MRFRDVTQGIRETTDSDLGVENDVFDSLFGKDSYDDFGEEYVDFLQAVKEATTVTKLTLIDITVTTVLRYHFVINTLCRHLPNATDLIISFDFSDVDEDAEASVMPQTMASALRCIERFESLDVEYNSTVDFPWESLAGHPALRELSVRTPHVYNIPATSFPVVTTSLSSIPTLRRAHIEKLVLHERTQDDLSCILNFFNLPLEKLALYDLTFSGPSFNARAVQLCAQGITSSSVEDLDLGISCAREEDCVSIFDALASKTNLRRLCLQYGRGINVHTCFPLARVLYSNRRLTSLSIHTASRIGIGRPNELAAVLEDTQCSLTELRLISTLSIQDATLFLAAVARSKLEAVFFHLESEEGFPEALLCELESISRVSTLKSLEVYDSSGGFSFDGPKLERNRGECIVERLYGSYSLQSVHLTFLDDVCQARLDTLESLNKAGRGYLISENRSKKAGIDVLGEVSSNLDCLYTHLRENPSLCDESEKRPASSQRSVD